jgi:hypothetical protein
MNCREEIIQNIKDCGQSLIDNAEKMVGDHKLLTDVTITCYVNERGCAPYISVSTDFMPEQFFERVK